VHFKPFVQRSQKNINKAVLKVITFKCHIVLQVSSERRICLRILLIAGGVNDLDLFSVVLETKEDSYFRYLCAECGSDIENMELRYNSVKIDFRCNIELF